MGSRVETVLAFLVATESLCNESELVDLGCEAAVANINVLLHECADLLGAFAALELLEATLHKLGSSE